MRSQRFTLFCDYLDELWAIKGLPAPTEAEKQNLYLEIAVGSFAQWIDIRANKEVIGFLIIGTAPNCHPDADFYIEEAYIKPDFRCRHRMLAAFSKFEKDHEGVYCLFILNKNETAKRFWSKAFAALGYVPCYLSDVGAGDEFCTQYGFRKQ